MSLFLYDLDMVFKISAEYFNIKKTLECGQVFRYKKTGENSYVVFSLDKKCELLQKDGYVCLKSEHIDYFIEYFDLNTDYKAVCESLSVFDEIKTQIEFGKGIRILKQDFYETVISFIISANNNIKRIQGIIEKLCEKKGEKMDGYYAFPTIEKLQELSVCDFVEMGLGYRAEYLYQTSRDFLKIKDEVVSLQTDEARKLLLSLKGVGPKVADCILLFGLNRFDSYPVDTWILKANKTPQLNTPQKVSEYCLNRYGKYAGLVQQFVFYYQRENKLG